MSPIFYGVSLLFTFSEANNKEKGRLKAKVRFACGNYPVWQYFFTN